MELGNAVFGNSRGCFHIPRGVGWEAELYRLFDSYAPERDNLWREYGAEYKNNTFEVMQYYWGDCDCGCDDKEYEWCDENERAKECHLMKPNFLYKPTGFEIQWYKYPLRDSYMNREISLSAFSRIIDDCIASCGVSPDDLA